MTAVLKISLVIIISLLFSCNRKDNCEFGIKYNAVRKDFRAILIDSSMVAESCSEKWTRYVWPEIPSDTIPFHASKTVWQTQDNKVIQEQDIYRKFINDTALQELQVYTVYDWSSIKLTFSGHIGITDKRSVYLKIKNKIHEQLKYPDYPAVSLKEDQIDSVLNKWGMSRKAK
jgi:hypothetical protein